VIVFSFLRMHTFHWIYIFFHVVYLVLLSVWKIILWTLRVTFILLSFWFFTCFPSHPIPSHPILSQYIHVMLPIMLFSPGFSADAVCNRLGQPTLACFIKDCTIRKKRQTGADIFHIAAYCIEYIDNFVYSAQQNC